MVGFSLVAQNQMQGDYMLSFGPWRNFFIACSELIMTGKLKRAHSI